MVRKSFIGETKMAPTYTIRTTRILLVVAVMVMMLDQPAAAQWQQYDYPAAKLSVAFPGAPDDISAAAG